MQLVLRPVGRGNWSPLVMSLEGKRLGELVLRVDDRLALGGRVLRVAQVVSAGAPVLERLVEPPAEPLGLFA
jgi:hypothetical protein